MRGGRGVRGGRGKREERQGREGRKGKWEGLVGGQQHTRGTAGCCLLH